MKLHHLIAALAIASTPGGSAAVAQADAGCMHADVVFYTTDTQDLAKQLGAAPSSCADYYISVAPFTSGPDIGEPKPGAALDAVHAQGQQFHALAEIRLKLWHDYAESHGWYETGRMLHDALVAAGYVPGRDSWAVNEVGWPSDSPDNTAVLDGTTGARADFRAFVHGLYDGTNGPPLPGVVFAASPIQTTPDLGAYEQALAAWYADEQFWQDMDRYVRLWGQETYADARSWGVDGAGLDLRAAALNDYFGHGTKLAHGAAASFFAHAYTPLANGSYRYPVPTPPGPAFGYTDVGGAGMLAFVSAETYALRLSSGSRFGFAVAPKNTASADERKAIEAHIGAAIVDSAGDPLGACTAAGESCDGVVAGAAFTRAWRDFATPPTVVPHVTGTLGDGGWYTSDVTVTWDAADEQTPVTSDGCDPRTIDSDTTGTTITCTATSSGGSARVSVTIERDATPPTATCVPTPDTLWPPNGKLVPVAVSVDVADDTSGPAGFVLSAKPSGDAAGFVLDTPDVEGLLRAARPGDGGDRVYRLTYTAADAAGTTSTCDAVVTVPHDLGR